MDWENRIQVQKGNLGERIIDEYLKDNGIIPYVAVFDGAHPFDRIIASLDKRNLFIADVKTKARRSHYPDTGIDTRSYEQYRYLMDKYNMRCFLFFIDEWLGKIYGNFLDVLAQPEVIIYKEKIINYPLIQRDIIYFPLLKMRIIALLDDETIEALKKLSSRKYLYDEF